MSCHQHAEPGGPLPRGAVPSRADGLWSCRHLSGRGSTCPGNGLSPAARAALRLIPAARMCGSAWAIGAGFPCDGLGAAGGFRGAL